MSNLQAIIGAIEPIHSDVVNQANDHLNQLTKPQEA